MVFGAGLRIASVNLDNVALGIGGFKITGENADDDAGVSVSSVGDVNGDGFDDLIVGAPGNGAGGEYAGAAYVVFGAASGIASINLENVALALGPHIGGCCYEVRDDCLEQFAAADLEGAVTRIGGRAHLDLGRVLRAQAERLGVPAGRIVVSSHCTRCHTDAEGRHPYASHRRASAGGQALGHINVAVIGRLLPAGDGGGDAG